MKKSDEVWLWVAFGVWVISKLDSPVRAAVKAVEQKGAEAYELLHPEQKKHADDLPGHQLTKQALLDLAQRTLFPDPALAVAIAMAESGGAPNALANTPREYSVGLWQINLRAHPQWTREEMADPEQNARAAFIVSNGGTNWSPWSTYKSGAYRSFM